MTAASLTSSIFQPNKAMAEEISLVPAAISRLAAGRMVRTRRAPSRVLPGFRLALGYTLF